MPPITDPATLATIRALDTAVRDIDARIVVMTAAGAETAARRVALLARIEAELPAPPAAPPPIDAVSAALAADPAAAITVQSTANVRKARQAYDAQAFDIAVIGEVMAGALDKIDGDAARIAEDLIVADHERRSAWAAFVIAAQQAMMAEFRTQFEALYQDTLGPLTALTRVSQPGERSPVVSGAIEHVTAESSVIIRSWNANMPTQSRLFPRHVDGGGTYMLDAHLQSFRDALQA